MLADFSQQEIREAMGRLLNHRYDLEKVTERLKRRLKKPLSWPQSNGAKVQDAYDAAVKQAETANLEQKKYNAEVLHNTTRRCDIVATLLVLQKVVDIISTSVPHLEMN